MYYMSTFGHSIFFFLYSNSISARTNVKLVIKKSIFLGTIYRTDCKSCLLFGIAKGGPLRLYVGPNYCHRFASKPIPFQQVSRDTRSVYDSKKKQACKAPFISCSHAPFKLQKLSASKVEWFLVLGPRYCQPCWPLFSLYQLNGAAMNYYFSYIYLYMSIKNPQGLSHSSSVFTLHISSKLL